MTTARIASVYLPTIGVWSAVRAIQWHRKYHRTGK